MHVPTGKFVVDCQLATLFGATAQRARVASPVHAKLFRFGHCVERTDDQLQIPFAAARLAAAAMPQIALVVVIDFIDWIATQSNAGVVFSVVLREHEKDVVRQRATVLESHAQRSPSWPKDDSVGLETFASGATAPGSRSRNVRHCVVGSLTPVTNTNTYAIRYSKNWQQTVCGKGLTMSYGQEKK